MDDKDQIVGTLHYMWQDCLTDQFHGAQPFLKCSQVTGHYRNVLILWNPKVY
jgi:hypothetical protein